MMQHYFDNSNEAKYEEIECIEFTLSGDLTVTSKKTVSGKTNKYWPSVLAFYVKSTM